MLPSSTVLLVTEELKHRKGESKEYPESIRPVDEQSGYESWVWYSREDSKWALTLWTLNKWNMFRLHHSLST